MHKAQCEHDWKQFRAAMDKEWVDQQDHGNYELNLASWWGMYAILLLEPLSK